MPIYYIPAADAAQLHTLLDISSTSDWCCCHLWRHQMPSLCLADWSSSPLWSNGGCCVVVFAFRAKGVMSIAAGVGVALASASNPSAGLPRLTRPGGYCKCITPGPTRKMWTAGVPGGAKQQDSESAARSTSEVASPAQRSLQSDRRAVKNERAP